MTLVGSLSLAFVSGDWHFFNVRDYLYLINILNIFLINLPSFLSIIIVILLIVFSYNFLFIKIRSFIKINISNIISIIIVLKININN